MSLVGGVLVGGRSSRMGRDKALIEFGGCRLVDRVAFALAAVASPVVVLGRSVEPWPWLEDPSGLDGPLSGLVALGAAYPEATLVVAAVDQPLLTAAALEWLVAQRRAGVQLVAALVAGQAQPLPCVVEPTALAMALEVAVGGGGYVALARRVAALWVDVPEELAPAWRDADTPTELDALLPRGPSSDW